MASERKGGLGMLGSSLVRATEPTPTRPAAPPEPVATVPTTAPAATAPESDDRPEADDQADAGQGGSPEPKAKKTRVPRTRRLDAGGPAVGCKLYLPQQLHGRLWQFSLERGKTISELAAEILDRHVPRYKVERQG